MQNTKYWLTLLIFLSWIISHEGWAKPISLQEAIEISLDQNPAVHAAQYGIQATEEAIGVARALYYPEVRIFGVISRWQRRVFFPRVSFNLPTQFQQLVGSNFFSISKTIGPTNDNQFALATRYLIFDSGRRRARLEMARIQRDIASERTDQLRHRLILNVHRAFYGLLSSLAMEQVAKEQLTRAEHHLQIVEQRKEVGMVTQADIYRVEVVVSRARQAIRRAQAKIAIARGKLNIAMGLPPNTPVEVINPAKFALKPKDEWVEAAFARAKDYRPEVQVALDRIEFASQQIKDAKAEGGLRVAAEGSFGFRDTVMPPHVQEWIVALTAEWAVFRGFGPTFAVRQAYALFHRAEEELRHIELKVQDEVWSSFANLEEAYDQLALVQAQVISARESLRATEQRYQAGSGTLTDLLDTQTALNRAETNYVTSEWKYWIAFARFQWSQGYCF